MTDRRNTRWTSKDELQLLDMLKNDQDISYIAEHIGRTERAVKSHQNHMARTFVRKGVSIEEVSKMVKKSIEEINTSIRISELSIESNKKRREERIKV